MRSSWIVGNRFEIVRLAGQGAEGSVFQARDLRDERPVAVKVLRARNAAGAARLAREAALLRGLDHPGVVRYVAHGVAGEDEPFLAMEWLDGGTLSDRFERGRLDVGESVRLAARLARALGAAHRRGIVHRDVKPSNVMLAGGSIERPALVDFGIACASGAAPATTGAPVGTPRYMAPEQARGERAVDARADVFSLGCVLFKALTGESPFTGADARSLLLELVDALPRVADRRADVPPVLDALVAGMLAKDRSGRLADGDAVADALEALERSPLSGRADARSTPRCEMAA